MPEKKRFDLGLAVFATLVATLLLMVVGLALMAFAPLLLALASAWLAYREERRALQLAPEYLVYRWMARLWRVMFWGILVFSIVLLVAAWFEYALVWNEIKVAVSVAWQKYTQPYLLLFGAMFVITVLLALGERVSAHLFHWVRVEVLPAFRHNRQLVWGMSIVMLGVLALLVWAWQHNWPRIGVEHVIHLLEGGK